MAVDLKPYGYYKIMKTNGLWKHKSYPISFTLIVDNFGVFYVDKADTKLLKSALKTHYLMNVKWTGDKYIVISLD